jgi:hypothetical protein
MIKAQTWLAKNPHDPKGLLCVADFVRQGVWIVSVLETQPKDDALGGSRSQFTDGPSALKGPSALIKAYQAILTNPKANADNKAYALYRAVKCYQATNDNYKSNYCGGENVPVAQREAWFQRLKKNYGSTRWAKELKYYW